MNTVEIRKISKSFNGVRAVDDVSLQIHEGEFFSLLGPSGCGKTTLLRMIAGLEFPDEGSILLSGKDMSTVPPNRRPVNMVFQSYALFPHLNVFENIAFGLRLAKVPSPQVDDRVHAALELVRLPGLSDRYPRELSGGQQQRVAFARAIVNKPAVLLLDEPLSALDPKIRLEMQSELARFKQELNITFVMVSHDQSEAFSLSDRMAVMSKGKVEQIGSPQEIYENPASTFVADFIGRTNILQGRVVSMNGDECLVDIGDGFKLTARLRQEFATDQSASLEGKVTLWVRSSAITLADASRSDDEHSAFNSLPVQILHRSFQGEWCDYQLKLSDSQQLTASVRNSLETRSQGEQCRAVISKEDLRFIS